MGLISYILSSDSRQAVKKLNKLAFKVEELEPKYQAMSDEQLKDQTRVLKERLAKGETLDDMYAERLPLYEKYADITIDCGANSIEKTVEEIVESVERLQNNS